MAKRMFQGSIVALVTPFRDGKVDEAALPRRDNIHWLGRREYLDLPAYAKGFDVCLMPFALNEATEFINPTKSLEYMASGRMIVSSAVPDVVANFGSVVRVGRSHEEFIQHCRAAVSTPDETTIAQGVAMAAANSWDSIVEELERHIQAVLSPRVGNKSSTAVAHGAI